MRRARVRATVATALAVAVAASGCGGGDSPGGGGSGISGTVTVFAAASLTESFTRIGDDFEAANPGTTVVFNFGGSSGLATQINEGAPADVFAAAAPRNMATVTDAGNADGTPSIFARNQLVIAVARGNPRGSAASPTWRGPGRRWRSAPSRCRAGRPRGRPWTPRRWT